MDVLRHAGRAPAVGLRRAAPNKAMDADVWSIAPYTEADLQEQVDKADDLYGAEGAQLQQDLADYVAGINQYISEARTDPTKMPYEYAAIGKPLEDWLEADRRDRDRLADRRHLRQGRRRRGRQRAVALQRGEGPLRRRRRRAGLAGLPPRGRPRGADHGEERQRLLRLSRPSAGTDPGVALPRRGLAGGPAEQQLDDASGCRRPARRAARRPRPARRRCPTRCWSRARSPSPGAPSR